MEDKKFWQISAVIILIIAALAYIYFWMKKTENIHPVNQVMVDTKTQPDTKPLTPSVASRFMAPTM